VAAFFFAGFFFFFAGFFGGFVVDTKSSSDSWEASESTETSNIEISFFSHFLCEFREPLFEIERLSRLSRYYETTRAAIGKALSGRGAVDAIRV